MTPQDQQQTRDAWDKLAAGFDEFTTPFAIPLGEDALRRVGLRPGMRFLDVAAGSGALSISAVRLGAQVLATDIAPTMIELLNARAREEGLSNVEARVMDGQALALEDDTFDVSGSQNGVSLFPDLKPDLKRGLRVGVGDQTAESTASEGRDSRRGYAVRSIDVILYQSSLVAPPVFSSSEDCRRQAS